MVSSKDVFAQILIHFMEFKFNWKQVRYNFIQNIFFISIIHDYVCWKEICWKQTYPIRHNSNPFLKNYKCDLFWYDETKHILSCFPYTNFNIIVIIGICQKMYIVMMCKLGNSTNSWWIKKFDGFLTLHEPFFFGNIFGFFLWCFCE